MKNLFFLVLLIFFSTTIHAQVKKASDMVIDMEILRADSIVPGIYFNMVEFLRNEPSIHLTTNENEVNATTYYYYKKKRKFYMLNDKGELRPFNGEHWGVCTGKKVHFLAYGAYQDLKIEGRFCQFSSGGSTYMAAPTSYNTYGSPYNMGSSTFNSTVYTVEDYYLDLVGGNITRVTLKNIKKLLKYEDTALYEEFKKEPDKKLMMFIYMNKLNQSYTYKK